MLIPCYTIGLSSNEKVYTFKVWVSADNHHQPDVDSMSLEERGTEKEKEEGA